MHHLIDGKEFIKHVAPVALFAHRIYVHYHYRFSNGFELNFISKKAGVSASTLRKIAKLEDVHVIT